MVSMIHLRFQMRNWNMKGKNWKPISNQSGRSISVPIPTLNYCFHRSTIFLSIMNFSPSIYLGTQICVSSEFVFKNPSFLEKQPLRHKDIFHHGFMSKKLMWRGIICWLESWNSTLPIIDMRSMKNQPAFIDL